jgi:ADP-ribose pyrophosphatase YjhB (NUDIX family)
VEHGDSVLLERRSDAPVWGLIAGRVDDDETVGAALKREVLEETELTVTGYRLFGTFSDPSRIVSYRMGASSASSRSCSSPRWRRSMGCRRAPSRRSSAFFAKRELLDLELPRQRHIVERYVSDAILPLVE